MKSLSRKIWIILASGALISLLVATHIPQDYMPSDLEWFNVDKLIHATAYGVVFALFVVAFCLGSGLRLFLGAVVLLGIGAVDEMTQGFVGRTGSVQDWFADAVGVLVIIGGGLTLRLRSTRCRKKLRCAV